MRPTTAAKRIADYYAKKGIRVQVLLGDDAYRYASHEVKIFRSQSQAISDVAIVDQDETEEITSDMWNQYGPWDKRDPFPGLDIVAENSSCLYIYPTLCG